LYVNARVCVFVPGWPAPRIDGEKRRAYGFPQVDASPAAARLSQWQRFAIMGSRAPVLS